MGDFVQQQRLEGEQQRLEGELQRLVDRMYAGVALVDAGGRIIFANVTFSGLVERLAGLRVEQGRLVGRAGERGVGELIERALSDHETQVLTLEDPEGRRAVLMAEADTRFGAGAAEERFVTLWLLDPSANPPSCRWLAQTYGLTPAERTVVQRLAQGLAPEQIAEGGSNSVYTVRTHLKRIFAKTGAGTQAALVRLAYLLP